MSGGKQSSIEMVLKGSEHRGMLCFGGPGDDRALR